MIGLFDRDVFLKLCCCDLWAHALQALNVTVPYRLESTTSEKSNLRIVARLLKGVSDELRVAAIEAAMERVGQVVASVSVLPPELVADIEASDDFQELSEIADIDAGEQILAAILLGSRDTACLISGDKRFVKAFRLHLPHQWAAVSSSVISFEACLIAIERQFGFDVVLENAGSAVCCDDSLRLSLGVNPDPANFLAGLRSFDPCT